ncbi:MAG: tyrosine-type recombinase/integrase [Lachnospiraceae bacterium]
MENENTSKSLIPELTVNNKLLTDECIKFIEKMHQEPSNCDIIEMSFMQGIEMLKLKREKEEVVNNWPYKVSYLEGKQLWRTNIGDETKKDGRRQITAKSEEELHRKMYEAWKEQCKSVRVFFYQYLDERLESGQIKRNTWERMDVSFRKSLTTIADKPLERLTDDDITQLLEDICKSKPSMSEYKNARNCIKKFFLWAKRNKYTNICVNDALEMAQVSPQKQCKRACKKETDEVWLDEELNVVIPSLIEHKNDMRSLAFLLDFATGLRIGEFSALKGIDLQEQSVIIRRSEHKYKKACGKGYDYVVENIDDDCGLSAVKTEASSREVIVPTEARWILRYLKSITADDEFVFRNDKGERYTSCALRSFWHDYLVSLGINYKKPHVIRKTYASILLDNKADDKFIITQAGHTDISTTEDYYHRDRKNIEKKIAILDTMQEFKILGEVTQGHTMIDDGNAHKMGIVEKQKVL